MPGTLTLHDVRLDTSGDHAELSVRIRADDPPPDAPAFPERVWLRLPRAQAAWLDDTPDPFVPPAYVTAACLGMDLAVPDGVSARLLECLPVIGNHWETRWSEGQPVRYRPPGVRAPARRRARRGDRAAAFFSGGVDSTFTVVHNLRRFPSDDCRAIRALVLVHGFDIFLHEEARYSRVLETLRPAADAVGLDLIPVATSVRELCQASDWGRYAHGPGLAHAALALAGGLHTMYVPSSATFVDLQLLGSHPSLDPLWSTEALEVVHDGAELSRIQRIGRLEARPDLLAILRVCWLNIGDLYNCGRCEKCVRTLLELWVNGLLQHAHSFPPLEPALLEQVTPDGSTVYHWVDLLREAEARGLSGALTDGLRRVLDRASLVAPGPAAPRAGPPPATPGTEGGGVSQAPAARLRAVLRGLRQGLGRGPSA